MKFCVLDAPPPDSPEDIAGRIDVMQAEGANYGPGPRCKRCNLSLGSKTWLPPYQIEVETWGKQYGDVVRSGNDLIVSDRFREAYEQAGLTGLEAFEPVEVVKVTHRRGKPQETMPSYFKATIVRSRTTVDQEASGMVWEGDGELCPECLIGGLFKRRERLVIKAETWSGEDVFFPRGINCPVVSERFRTLFDQQGLVGAVLIPAEEDRVDFYPWETASEAK